METAIKQKHETFAQKSKRMKEPHIVSFEVYVDKLYLNSQSAKVFNRNNGSIKIRVKFANFPCMEINGTFQEENLELEMASMRTLRAESVREINEKDFYRRGRVSLASNIIKQETRKLLKQDQLKSLKRTYQDEENQPKDAKTNKTLTKTKNKRDSFSKKNSLSKSDIEDSGGEATDSEGTKSQIKHKSEPEANRSAPTGQRSESIVSWKNENVIPFNGCKAIIFPITPHELMYQLINKPLKLFLIDYIHKSSVELIGETTISLYPLSDIVPHMTLLQGGIHSVSKMEGIFRIYRTDLKDCSKIALGEVKLEIQIASYGTSSCARLSMLGRVSNVKFMTDESVENLEEQTLPQVVRDASYKLPIITGNEHILAPEAMPDLPFKLGKGNSGLYKCAFKWEDIPEA